MKVSELMIGDWVQYDRSYPPMGTMKAIQVTLQDLIDISQCNECDPIPLTAEILEKNGWEHDRIFMEKRVDENTHLSWTDRYGAVLYRNNYHMCDCKYVHTLQHALRLCGLNDLADNFKV